MTRLAFRLDALRLVRFDVRYGCSILPLGVFGSWVRRFSAIWLMKLLVPGERCEVARLADGVGAEEASGFVSVESDVGTAFEVLIGFFAFEAYLQVKRM